MIETRRQPRRLHSVDPRGSRDSEYEGQRIREPGPCNLRRAPGVCRRTMGSPPQEADADVHLRLRAGDYRGAFERLLPRYRGRVFRLAFSMLRNSTEAEDVAQDVFLRLWRALPGYSG